MAKRYMLGTFVLNDRQVSASDMDDNGKIDQTDLLSLKRKMINGF